MMEALAGRARHLAPEIRERLPREAHTIHRLLGVATGSSRFRHHAGNPLALDVLVVDEASMLDLALAVHLVEAIPEDARLILLGDKDQLAAVEAGAVFGELTADPTLSAGCVQRLAAATGTPAEAIQADAPPVTPPLADGVMWLTESHRFGSDSDVGRLAALVNAGAAEAALDQLTASKGGSLAWLEDAGAELCPAVRTRIVEGYAAYVDALRRDSADASAVFAAFDRFRVLCALRDTPRGVDAANALIGEHVRCALDHALDPGPESHWYPGRPVMVLRNDYTLKLFNGDIGICLPDEKGELLVTFPSVDGAWRRIAPVRLPPHDTAFAITVHKAQGSEFAAVLLVLPRHAAKVVVRESLYTAITRASESVVICGAVEVFRSACMQPTLRRSGLTARMQEAIATSEAPRPSHLLDPEQGALRIR
jgi:exodeoxyribonuclease V alpha subunit